MSLAEDIEIDTITGKEKKEGCDQGIIFVRTLIWGTKWVMKHISLGKNIRQNLRFYSIKGIWKIHRGTFTYYNELTFYGLWLNFNSKLNTYVDTHTNEIIPLIFNEL